MSSQSEPATKGDIERLAAATKSDIENLAAANKSDIERIAAANKEDIERLTTANKDGMQRLALRIDGVEGRIDRLHGQWTQLFTQFKSDIFGKLDYCIAKLETYSRETLTIPKTLDEHGKTLLDHTKRITALEYHP